MAGELPRSPVPPSRLASVEIYTLGPYGQQRRLLVRQPNARQPKPRQNNGRTTNQTKTGTTSQAARPWLPATVASPASAIPGWMVPAPFASSASASAVRDTATTGAPAVAMPAP